MHMADALVSPAVGGTMWAVSGGLIGYCSKRVRSLSDDRRVPLMGVLGAFVFAAQMINFSIPGTGSSGHLGGGLLLAVLLGPYAAFLAIASVLVVQALFFADGGLLALGCNIFNMGFLPCLVAYPLIYRKLAGNNPTPTRLWSACVAAAILGLQLGAFAVVLQTVLSGISVLPFRTFAFLMQPIHLAIGVVEGLVTAAVVAFVRKSRPEVLDAVPLPRSTGRLGSRRVIVTLVAATIVIGGGLSWFASSRPDGLEWAVFKTSGKEELEPPEHGMHESLAGIQEKTSVLPDYSFALPEEDAAEPTSADWPAIDTGTTVAGLVGGCVTLLVVLAVGYGLSRRGGSRSGGVCV